jgi:hypothetical protein
MHGAFGASATPVLSIASALFILVACRHGEAPALFVATHDGAIVRPLENAIDGGCVNVCWMDGMQNNDESLERYALDTKHYGWFY